MRYLAISSILILWLTIFCGPAGPTNPCLTKEDIVSETTPTPIPDALMKEVLEKHRERFRAYPNYRGSGWGLITDPTVTPSGTPLRILGRGITVSVTEIVDPETLPESERIPPCLEGVPVVIRTRGTIVIADNLPDPEEDDEEENNNNG